MEMKIYNFIKIVPEVWLKNIDETRKYLTEEINWNESIRKKHK